MNVLVLNCGSSSIKYQLFETEESHVHAKGVVEKIGLKGSFVKHTKENGQKVKFEGEILDHQTGIEYVLGILSSNKHGCISSLDEIEAVGHRVAHGGETFKQSAYLNDQAIQKIEEIADLAPLHNPANLKGIYAIQTLIPQVDQVAVFDTSFHQSMPDYAYMYGIPYSLYKKYGIRRYGFHGTSHRYVMNTGCEFLGKKPEDLKIITCHLGNGASVAAIDGGKSVDTSMGFTPIEGLMMGTRSGDLDLGALTYIMQKEEIGLPATNTLINKFSGLLGVSGVSSDQREIEEQAWEKGNERAKLGLDMFAYRVKKYIGSYVAALGGLDVLIFTGGVGENAPEMREMITDGLQYMGIELDKEKNDGLRGKEALISSDKGSVDTLVIPTNEELIIALDTEKIVSSR